jgi:hypothetical protein
MKKYYIRSENAGWVKEITYNEICHRLNIAPESKFVKITSAGTIGGTTGKLDEFKYLLKAISEAKFVPTKKLVKLCEGE